MRRIEVDGDYVSLETSTDEDLRREMADDWAEVATVKTELLWPPEDTKRTATPVELAAVRDASPEALGAVPWFEIEE